MLDPTHRDLANFTDLLQAGVCSEELVDRYYTLCIPFFREFLGSHWHTGYYSPAGPIGPRDQLRMELHIAASAGLTPECEVLDVGCGIGGVACHLAARTGARIRGLTPISAQIDLAHKLAQVSGVRDRVDFDQGSANNLPYDNASFDVVLFFESPCHFTDRVRFFREVKRVLRPGGRLAGEDWLASETLSPDDYARWIDPVCKSWAIPQLGTLSKYKDDMCSAGLCVREAVDMREEMPVARGFLVEPSDRASLLLEIQQTGDPMRQIIEQGLVHLGAAMSVGAFTIGRFLAVCEPDTCGP